MNFGKFQEQLIFKSEDFFKLCTGNPLLIASYNYIELQYQFIKKYKKIYNVLRRIATNDGTFSETSSRLQSILEKTSYKFEYPNVVVSIDIMLTHWISNRIDITVHANGTLIELNDDEKDIIYRFYNHRQELNTHMRVYQYKKDEMLL